MYVNIAMDVLQREIGTTTTNEWMGECTCERERERERWVPKPLMTR